MRGPGCRRPRAKCGPQQPSRRLAQTAGGETSSWRCAAAAAAAAAYLWRLAARCQASIDRPGCFAAPSRTWNAARVCVCRGGPHSPVYLGAHSKWPASCFLLQRVWRPPISGSIDTEHRQLQETSSHGQVGPLQSLRPNANVGQHKLAALT